jgi:hypothetical protein
MRALLLAGIVAVAAACHERADGPLEPVWGKQPCDHCAMLLDEPRFAAQAVAKDGSRLYFDDVGCLAGWLEEHPAGAAQAWVRAGERWLPPAEARFTAGEHTPMGYGFVAATRGVAWSEVRARLRAAAPSAQLEVGHAQ